jgi:transposase InsO family protein
LTVFHNLAKDMKPDGPNQAWAADITYIRTDEGFLYLSLLTELWSRKIAGYHAGDTLEAEGALRALDMALANLPDGASPVHHSGRGCQYCSHRHVEKLQAHGLAISRHGASLLRKRPCRTAQRDFEAGIRFGYFTAE